MAYEVNVDVWWPTTVKTGGAAYTASTNGTFQHHNYDRIKTNDWALVVWELPWDKRPRTVGISYCKPPNFRNTECLRFPNSDHFVTYQVCGFKVYRLCIQVLVYGERDFVMSNSRDSGTIAKIANIRQFTAPQYYWVQNFQAYTTFYPLKGELADNFQGHAAPPPNHPLPDQPPPLSYFTAPLQITIADSHLMFRPVSRYRTSTRKQTNENWMKNKMKVWSDQPF